MSLVKVIEEYEKAKALWYSKLYEDARILAIIQNIPYSLVVDLVYSKVNRTGKNAHTMFLNDFYAAAENIANAHALKKVQKAKRETFYGK